MEPLRKTHIRNEKYYHKNNRKHIWKWRNVRKAEKYYFKITYLKWTSSTDISNSLKKYQKTILNQIFRYRYSHYTQFMWPRPLTPSPSPPPPSPPSQKNTISHELKKYLKKTFQDQKLRCKFNSKVFNINMKSPEKRILSELKEYQNYYTQVMWPPGRHILCEQKQYHETFSNQWFRR